jgi:hypothetical protein
MSSLVSFIFDNIYYCRKYLYYRISLYKKLLECTYYPEDCPWWSEIIDGIILGAIPLKNYYHDYILVNEENIKCVLTILEPFEIDTITYLSQPVSQEDWTKYSIDQKIINSEDFGPLKLKDLHEAVLYLEQCVSSKKKIYVHCKAGHGRSAMVTIAYLIKNHGMSLDEAHIYTKDRRSTVNINRQQYESLKEYDWFIKQNSGKSKS